MSSFVQPDQDYHFDQPIHLRGNPLTSAQAALVLLHGRGGSPEDMLSLASQFYRPGVAYLAPQARGGWWYPQRFFVPLEQNEPWLSSALNLVENTFREIAEEDLPLEKTVLLGFSQGACLALEFAARYPGRYGGVVAFSGGLIGPLDPQRQPSAQPSGRVGSLSGTPVFIGCSDVDPHIPLEYVHASAAFFQRAGAQVTLQVYPEMGHTVNEDEIVYVRGLLNRLLQDDSVLDVNHLG